MRPTHALQLCALAAAGVFSVSLPAASLQLSPVVTGLSSPLDIQNAGDGSGRLFVVEKGGTIRVLLAGTLLPDPFLDIHAKVSTGSEQGLLGLAFPPGYASRQYFYVNYTNVDGDTVIARYRTTTNPNVADPATEQILLTIDQPFSNHNGGQLRFSARDGYLYIGMGDGGSGGDPQGNAQNPMSLLGKMLRVRVEPDLDHVEIPPDNPFVGDPAYRGEIWALGLRNPFRFSFDRRTGDLWIGDVGQSRFEEVDYQPGASAGGENYGWNEMEGFECYLSGCDTSGLTLPAAVYDHSLGCAVIGGFVYRGARFPALRGTYLYSDNCSGTIWGIRKSGDQFISRTLLETGLGISCFGEGQAGELYVADLNGGTVYRVIVTP